AEPAGRGHEHAGEPEEGGVPGGGGLEDLADIAGFEVVADEVILDEVEGADGGWVDERDEVRVPASELAHLTRFGGGADEGIHGEQVLPGLEDGRDHLVVGVRARAEDDGVDV